MLSLPSNSHKHFRAMQGRKLCLAVPHPLSPPFQLSEDRIFHFCSQTLLGSNWNKSKTARRPGHL